MKRAFEVAPFAVFLLWLLSILLPVQAEEPAKTEPTVQSLTAEVAELKRQLAQVQTAFTYEMRVCSAAIQAGREFVNTANQPPVKQPTAKTSLKEKPKP